MPLILCPCEISDGLYQNPLPCGAHRGAYIKRCFRCVFNSFSRLILHFTTKKGGFLLISFEFSHKISKKPYKIRAFSYISLSISIPCKHFVNCEHFRACIVICLTFFTLFSIFLCYFLYTFRALCFSFPAYLF